MDGTRRFSDRTVESLRRSRQGTGSRRRSVALVAAPAVVAVAGFVSACAPPPPVCPPSIRAAQKEAFVKSGGTWDEGAQWLFGWHWSNPHNCAEPAGGGPVDPQEPEPVVPEAPLAVMLPVGAALVGGGAVVWNRRRRPAAL